MKELQNQLLRLLKPDNWEVKCLFENIHDRRYTIIGIYHLAPIHESANQPKIKMESETRQNDEFRTKAAKLVALFTNMLKDNKLCYDLALAEFTHSTSQTWDGPIIQMFGIPSPSANHFIFLIHSSSTINLFNPIPTNPDLLRKSIISHILSYLLYPRWLPKNKIGRRLSIWKVQFSGCWAILTQSWRGKN